MADENLKIYRANCHCGAFVCEVKLPEIKAYDKCNCSICHKKGYAWLVHREEQRNIVKGSVDNLTSYVFNNGEFTHRFCPDCGTALMADNRESYGINARAIQDLDIWSLDAKPLDGKALPPPYKAPVFTGPEPSAEVENGKIYHGSCHCGAVTVALKIKPLETWDISVDEERIVECNCSICVRNAYVWIYLDTDQSVVEGREHLSYRVFNRKIARKAFCKHCGVHLFNEQNPLTEEESEALSDSLKPRHAAMVTRRNISLRILNDFDCSTLETRKLDGKNLIEGDYINP